MNRIIASDYFTQLPSDVEKHCIRTGQYARILGSHIPSLQEEYSCKSKKFILDALQAGGILHDIGKCMYSTHLLNKPQKLTQTEWSIVQLHPLRAIEILSTDTYFVKQDITFQKIILDICSCHHEHVDGSGYPAGLKGRAIPIVAQIVSLCDVFDALTTYRPYKETLTFDQAMDLISGQSGTHFSPMLIGYMYECADELRTIGVKFDISKTLMQNKALFYEPIKVK